jgi:pimeloyl-ACP methyl ester carboxylesterase
MGEEWYTDDITVNGIKIHYHRTGGDKPPVVLAHGITDNGLCWTQFAQVLERDYDVIMYDARGHGLSEHPPTGYTYTALAGDLAGLIQALGLKRPRLIGHSMGAATVAFATAHHPELASCAVLEDPPWRSESQAASLEERAAAADEWRTRNLEQKSLGHDEIVARGRADNPRWAESEFVPWADAKKQVSPAVFGLLTADSPFWADFIGEIECPVLLVTGEPALGAIVTPEMAQKASSLLQNGSIVHISGAGHCVRREAPEKYAAAVTGFLKTEC